MSKAKELAEQMFPEPQMENYDDILEYRNDRDWTFIARGAFVKGYEQAEKDLELTWQDIQRIVKVADQMVDEDRGKFMAMEDEDYYKEVLARYVKQSEKP